MIRFKLAVKDIVFYKESSLAIFFGVFIASALIVFSSILGMGFLRGMETGLERFGPDLAVVPKGRGENFKDVLISGISEKFYFKYDEVKEIEEIDGVDKTTPQLFIESAPASCCTAGNVFIVGYDPGTDFIILPWTTSAGPGSPSENKAIVGSNIIRPPGLPIIFYNYRFIVDTKLDESGFGFFDNGVFIKLEDAYRMAEETESKKDTQRLMIERGDVSALLVSLEAGSETLKIKKEIEKEYEDLEVVVLNSFISQIEEKFQTLIGWIRTTGIIIWFTVFFLAGVIIYQDVLVKIRVFGVLRAVGMNKRMLTQTVAIKSFILALLSSITGFGFGLLVSVMFSGWFVVMLKMPYKVPDNTGKLYLGILVVISASVSIFAAIISSLLKINGMEPYECIKKGE